MNLVRALATLAAWEREARHRRWQADLEHSLMTATLDVVTREEERLDAECDAEREWREREERAAADD
jgi:hypothetical protein